MRHIKSGKRLSGAVVHGGVVYVSGQVPDDLKAGVEAQTRQVLDKIDTILREAGSDASKVVSAMIWLTDIQDKDAMNTAWDAWAANPGPARACVESGLASPDIKVEISVVAVAGEAT